MSSQDENTVPIMDQFKPIFEQLIMLKKTDSEYSSRILLQLHEFSMLCQKLKDSVEFKNFCMTNEEFRSTVYKYNFGYKIDEIMCGQSCEYMSYMYPHETGTLGKTSSHDSCNYTVYWRGIFTCGVIIDDNGASAYNSTHTFVDKDGSIYYKAIPPYSYPSPEPI